jgi:crotonobetainyl-CoA:carnitine CoA-transferase CaiB-like acyl-CoA transferase
MPGALEGVKVVAFEQVVAMPAACAILADWGADVVKVEPIWGDWMRSFTSFLNTPLILKYERGDIQAHFEVLNRGKRSIALNLKSEKGLEILHRLIKTADVFVTNYSLDVIESFHLDYNSLKDMHPGLVYCLFTGYGTKGPLAGERGYDYTSAWAYGGLLELMGEPGEVPATQRPGFMDVIAGTTMAGGVAAALYRKRISGKGQSLELSLYNTAVWTIACDIQTRLYGQPPKKWDRKRAPNPMFNYYRSKDGRWFYLSNLNQSYWKPFCTAVGRPEWEQDPRYATMESRSANCEQLVKELDDIFSTKNLEEIIKSFKDNDVICAKAQTLDEIIDEEQATANEFFTELEHPIVGKARIVNSPVKFSDTAARIEQVAPQLGANTEEVLLELGYSWDDMAEMKDNKVIV